MHYKKIVYYFFIYFYILYLSGFYEILSQKYFAKSHFGHF
jgi:hypothetical protein